MGSEGLGPIGQIHVSVTDLEGSVAFYRDTLGLPLLFTVPGQSMAFFDAGGVRLYLGVPETAELRSNPLLYFRVDDIQEAHRTLRGRGVRFRDEPHVVHRADGVELWMAFFVDPDGTTLALMAERPEA
ncbi:MAG TPA: VOC family protein [Actinomycetota bacterium]